MHCGINMGEIQKISWFWTFIYHHLGETNGSQIWIPAPRCSLGARKGPKACGLLGAPCILFSKCPRQKLEGSIRKKISRSVSIKSLIEKIKYALSIGTLFAMDLRWIWDGFEVRKKGGVYEPGEETCSWCWHTVSTRLPSFGPRECQRVWGGRLLFNSCNTKQPWCQRTWPKLPSKKN